nr:nucleic acid-binding, OB-fold protein [Tanacetum cinerariifolium]
SSGLRRFFLYAMFIYSFYLRYSLSLFPFTERYAQLYFFSCLIRQTFKTLCLLNYALMIRHDYDVTSSLQRGALQLWYSDPGYETVGSKDLICEDWMVNTRTDADLSAAVQNALQALLPQIRAEICEEFRMSSGPSDAGGNLPPVTIHTWLERLNKQKPHSFEKATAPVDAENWISHMEKIFDVMGSLRIGQDNFMLEARVYRKWTSKNITDMKELAFCCILIDRENNAIQENMDINNLNHFNPLLKLNAVYRFLHFNCEKTKPYHQTLENLISLNFGKITTFEVLTGKESKFLEHHFEFIAYNQLASRVPYQDEY